MCGIGADRVGKLLAHSPVGDIADPVRQAGDQIKAHVFRILQIPAARVGVQQRTRLDPIFVRGIDFEALGTGVASPCSAHYAHRSCR